MRRHLNAQVWLLEMAVRCSASAGPWASLWALLGGDNLDMLLRAVVDRAW